jgi:prepilin-type processing-associated H-X9-DG protein
MNLAGGGSGTGTLTAAPLAQLGAPASTVAIIEVNQCDNSTAVPGTEVPNNNDSTPSVNGLAYAGGNSVVNIAGHCTNLDTGDFYNTTGGYGNTARHTNGANYELADGHAKWFQPGAVSSGFDAGSPTSTQTTTGSNPVIGNAAGTGALNSPLAATFSAI